eukprot:TRINITY_DN1613_c0_g1_i2.p1 TRINITY_DN1613_c0_g1~~TRINITY_DN1613_c0_g1_i2.p1  ORF type:complete len:449 (+),score=123.77 TRINITY_DN1613_c0_g1_i2:116-1462(+)
MEEGNKNEESRVLVKGSELYEVVQLEVDKGRSKYHFVDTLSRIWFGPILGQTINSNSLDEYWPEVASNSHGAWKGIRHEIIKIDPKVAVAQGWNPGDPLKVLLRIKPIEKKMNGGIGINQVVQVDSKGMGPISFLSYGRTNVFGAGEAISAKVEMYMKSLKRQFQVEFRKPLDISSPIPSHFIATLFHNSNEQELQAFHQNDSGLSLSYSKGHHTFQWLGSIRNVIPRSDAPFEIRQFSGESFKSAIKHVYRLDNRDDPSLPTVGWANSISSEIAGAGGDVHHVKQEAMVQYNFPLHNGLGTFNLFGQFGYILPYNGDRVRTCDRIHMQMVGFERFGVGPRSYGKPLGGGLHYCLAAHLTSNNLIKDFGLPVHGQIYIKAGNLANAPESSIGSVKECLTNLVDPTNARVVVGGGLVVPFQNIRLELNHTIAVKVAPTDLTKSFVLSFL